MVPEEGMRIWFQQDTTRSAVAKDSLVRQVQDTAKKGVPSLNPVPSGDSLNALEKLFMRTDRRLKKDSVTAARKVHVAVKKKEPEKILQEPSDSVFVMQVTALPPDNGPLSLISRSSSAREFLAADSTRTYRPLRKKELPLKTRNTVQEAPETVAVAVKREPAYLRENWILGVLILAFLLITWTKIRFGKLLNQTLSGIWNYKNSNALFRNKSSLYQWTSVILTSNFFLTFTLFIYLFLKAVYPSVFTGDLSHMKIYIYIMAGVVAVYFYFMLMIRITGLISLAREPMQEFSAFTKLFFHNVGLFLFPLTAIIPYVYEPVAKQLLWLGVIVVALLYLFRVVKLITIFIQKRFSLFLMILYLCTLEILPVAILLKIISE